jgi:hypothetical protein
VLDAGRSSHALASASFAHDVGPIGCSASLISASLPGQIRSYYSKSGDI